MDMLKGMMERNPESRLTVEQALKHAWIKKFVKAPDALKRSKSSARGFDHQQTVKNQSNVSQVRHNAAL
jgi:serine/threonine protein kinase